MDKRGRGKKVSDDGFYQPLSRARSEHITRRLALQFFSAGLFRTRGLCDAVVEGDFSRIVNYDLKLYDFDDPKQVRMSRAGLALFRKNEDLRLGVDTRRVAWQKFVDSERTCKETNRRLWEQLRGLEPGASPFFLMVQRKIAELLGPAPSLSKLKCRFGPGSNTTCRGSTVGLRYKLRAPLACSAELAASPLLGELRQLYPALFLDEFGNPRPILIDVGRWTAVPKDARGGRGIITEPLLNTFVQLGIDAYIKDLLLKVGIDLRDQSVNQRLAYWGSLRGIFATLDLSSASDLICSRLVVECFPHDWLELFSSCRTGRVSSPYYNGVFELAKFSSMGNGMTFVLETVLFWAISSVATSLSSCDPSLVRVYGDDIIVPTNAYEKVSKALRLCGFKLNDTKSFSEGPFRESCGADYLSGIDVRPFFLKKRWSPARIVSFCNFYTRNGWFSPHEIGWLLDELEEGQILFGPDGFGDGHLISDDRECLTPFGRSRGYAGWTFRTHTQKANADGAPLDRGDFRLPAGTLPEEQPPLMRSVRQLRDKRSLLSEEVAEILSWPEPQRTTQFNLGGEPQTLYGVLRGDTGRAEIKRVYVHRLPETMQ